MQRRRVLTWATAAAVLLFAAAGWLWIRPRQSVEVTTVAVLDLRDRSVSRGQSPSATSQAPLEIPRTTKHLILDLPIGSNEGLYDVGLLTQAGDQILSATGIARLHDHVTDLRVDIDLRSVQPGSYSLGVRQDGVEWSRYLIRVF